MKAKISTLLLFLCCAVLPMHAQTFPVTLSIVDEFGGARTNDATNNNNTNVFIWIDANLVSQNPRLPGEWWYPMYNNSGATPDGNLSVSGTTWTWSTTLNAVPGTYEWNPYLKSLGWQAMNGRVTGVDWGEGNLSFTVDATGNITGTTSLVIARQLLTTVTLQIVDMTAGAATQGSGTNTDRNVWAWVGGDISQSGTWWAPFYYDATTGPDALLTKEADRWTWQASFDIYSADSYDWNPYVGAVADEITIKSAFPTMSWPSADNNLHYTVAADGTVSGTTVLTIPATILSSATNTIDNLTLTTNAGRLLVVGDFDTLELYSVSGLLLGQATANNRFEMALNKGIYIVRADGASQKVVMP